MSVPTPRLAAAAGLALLAAPAAAQVRPDSARGDSVPRTIEPVVVRGTRIPAVVGAAAAVVADVDSLHLPAAPVLAQALREMPFILVRRNSRGEDELSVRGSDSRQAAVLVDGVPLTLGWDHRADPTLVPLAAAQRVTLVRGLSSLLHGPNVLGGVVEVGLGGGGRPSAAATASLTTDVDQFGGAGMSLAASTPLDRAGRVRASGGVGWRDRPGVALSGDVADLGGNPDLRVNSDARRVDGFASLRYAGATGAHAGVTVSALQAARGVEPELHVAEPRLWRYPVQRRVLATATAGTGTRATAWGHGGVQASLGVHAGRTEIESFATPAFDAVTGTEEGAERTVTARVLAEHSFGAAVLKAAATVADVAYDETLDDDPSARYRQRLWSVGAEATVPVGPLVEVGGGVVLDRASTPQTGGREALGALSRSGARVGVAVQAPGDVRLHLSASQRSRFPALRELYSGALNRFAPNPGLRPETLLGAEVGVTRTWARAELQAALFRHQLRDAVVRTTLPDRRFLRVNRDEIRSTGVELLGAWRSAAGVGIVGDATVQRVLLLDPAAPADERRAEHQPSLRLGLDVGVPLPLRARGTASVEHAGRQFCTNPDLGAQQTLGAQTRADLAVDRAWSLGRAAGALFRTLRVALAVDNVADAAVYDVCGLPQPGRTARLTVELR